jgi:lysophospholipase L1-like esterase
VLRTTHKITRDKLSLRVIRGSFVFAVLMALNGCNSSTPITSQQRGKGKIDTMQTRTAGPLHYVALGDSTGSGVGARDGGYVARLFKRVRAARPESTLTNLCVSGATTEDVIREQLDRAIAANPSLITLGIGINDIGHGVSPEAFAENYETIVARLASGADAPVIITNIPDTSTAPRIPEAMRAEINRRIILFNEKIYEIGTRHGATVFDVYSMTHEELPDHPEYFSADGFHPSDEGYEVWAQTMWPTLARVIGAPVEW